MQADGEKVTTSLTQLLTGKATITTSLTRYIHGSDSGMDTMGLTYHFLI